MTNQERFMFSTNEGSAFVTNARRASAHDESRSQEGRVSLYGVDPLDALSAMLRTPKSED